jgi:drug/metabolite transporter (DMT)-like permease
MMWSGRLLAMVAVFFWGATYVWGKTVLAWLPPFTAASLRYGLAVILLLPFLVRGGNPLRLLRRHWRFYVLQGFVGLTCFQAFLFSALSLSSPISVSVIMALTPLLTAFAAAIVLREKLARRALAGMGISVVGAVLAVLGANPRGLAGMSLDWGIPLALAAVTCMAFYTIAARRLTPANVRGTTNMALVLAIGAVFLLPLAATEPPVAASGSPAQLWALAGLVLGSTVIGYLAWNESIRRIGVAGPNLIYNFIPLVTILLSSLQGELPWPEQGLGAVLVIAGVTFSMLPRGAVRPGLLKATRPAR